MIILLQHFHTSHKAPHLTPPPPKKKKKNCKTCFSFLLGIAAVIRGIENNVYAIFFFCLGGRGGEGKGKWGALWGMWKWRIGAFRLSSTQCTIFTLDILFDLKCLRDEPLPILSSFDWERHLNVNKKRSNSPVTSVEPFQTRTAVQ